MATEANRPISDVLQDILRNIQTIIRAEVTLAKVEVREEASNAFASIAWLLVGALSGAFAILFLLWTIAYAIARVWPLWAATLLLAVLLGAAALMLFLSGRRRFRRLHATPEQTVQTIKENVAWVRQSIR
jgi:uncharacterized membrane protein YqjE